MEICNDQTPIKPVFILVYFACFDFVQLRSGAYAYTDTLTNTRTNTCSI